MRNVSVATRSLIAAFSITGCFNPNASITAGDVGDDGGSSAGGSSEGTSSVTADTTAASESTGSTSCTPSATQDCTCTDGSAGMRTCNADGTAFGACTCPGGESSSSGDTSSSTGPMPECINDDGCLGLADACNAGVCDRGGSCTLSPLEEGTDCTPGAATTCGGSYLCDGAGSCVNVAIPFGVSCSDCGADVCACDGSGTCEPCITLADINDFNTSRSLVGWQLSGGWGLYDAAPQSATLPTVPFGSRVFGTDGGRRQPYPLAEAENSVATSAHFVLPDTLSFYSWHVDEGGFACGPDRKGVFASTDGVTWLPILDCCTPGLEGPFCQLFNAPRAGFEWDFVSAPMPPGLGGMVGQIQFRYETLDACCGFEQGWFIDTATIAPECACANDEICTALGGECGPAVCGSDGQCRIEAVTPGTPCGDASASTCSAADACNGAGACSPSNALNGPQPYCYECPIGTTCGGCVDGACVDCPTGEIDAFDTFAWVAIANEDTASPGWGVYYQAPPNNLPDSVPIPFGERGAVIGTDGNRIAPYPAPPANTHSESSSWVTTAFTIPATITFESWNLDEGGGGNNLDNKIIELTVDGGLSWNVLANCAVDAAFPFCTAVLDRAPDAWDPIALNTAPWQGMGGQLRFSYDTQDQCCDVERGWYINDLNVLSLCTGPVPAP